MPQRSIVGASKTGSITRLQAREAAKAVKMARSKSGEKGQRVSASVVERYLGKFGTGGSTTVTKERSGGRKTTGDKSRSKKAAADRTRP